jgi:hypothetical protein
MINVLELAGVMILCGACFAMGMYFTTQIGGWIKRRTKNEE